MAEIILKQVICQSFDGEMVSIAFSETPVIYCGGNNRSVEIETIAVVVNFLRSGCPSVQLVYDRPEYDLERIDKNLDEYFKRIALDEERFDIFKKFVRPTVFLVSRTKEKEKEE